MAGEIKVSISTVAAHFWRMALTGQRIDDMVDMVFLVFHHFHIYRRAGWSQSFTLKIFVSFSLGGGGGCFSVPLGGDRLDFGEEPVSAICN